MINHTVNKVADPLERFLAGTVGLLSPNTLEINSAIHAIVAEVTTQNENELEEKGMLYFFPDTIGSFHLHICFLYYKEQSSVNPIACSFQFRPSFLAQFPITSFLAEKPFSSAENSEIQFAICAKTRHLLAEFEGNATEPSFLQLLHLSETASHLLRKAIGNISVPFMACQVPACRFLAYDTEREKIQDAIQAINNNQEQPFTIRQLSRKIGMNECYLKKGFKTVTGKTIHEYQQELRITKAKILLQQEHYSVTDVAAILGYSSISHFSTAFKRVTGTKPCELLS